MNFRRLLFWVVWCSYCLFTFVISVKPIGQHFVLLKWLKSYNWDCRFLSLKLLSAWKHCAFWFLAKDAHENIKLWLILAWKLSNMFMSLLALSGSCHNLWTFNLCFLGFCDYIFWRSPINLFHFYQLLLDNVCFCFNFFHWSSSCCWSVITIHIHV